MEVRYYGGGLIIVFKIIIYSQDDFKKDISSFLFAESSFDVFYSCNCGFKYVV